MAVSTTIHIDPELGRQAAELFDTFGLDMSTAVNLFLRQSVREQAIPFRIGQQVYNEETLQAIRDARAGIGLSKAYHSAAELFAALDAEDEEDGEDA